ncbi:hypothetical protein SATRM34S_03432 [Streptomyces atroolivaceus]
MIDFNNNYVLFPGHLEAGDQRPRRRRRAAPDQMHGQGPLNPSVWRYYRGAQILDVEPEIGEVGEIPEEPDTAEDDD